jgi:UTP--glucose-1-phosphate uridylyltransferase
MGAAIEVFPGATAIGVGRERFLPVKTTSDLLVLRSDVYEVESDGRLTKVVETAPIIELDSKYYKTIAAFEQRFPEEAPSLRQATSLSVKGDWTFQRGVRVEGAVSLSDPSEPRTITAGTVLGAEPAPARS